MSSITSTTAEPVWPPLFAAWLVAAVATLGALFLGEVMGLAPCVLCWWQRIFMFPMAIVLAIGLLTTDVRVTRYALPLSMGGWLVAAYHLLLVEGIVPASLAPCEAGGVSCSEVAVRWFGFVTIPLLSVAAFSATVLLLVTALIRNRS